MSSDIRSDVRVIRFQGAILRKDSEKIEAELVQSTDFDFRNVVLDFTRVHHICSSALGVLVAFKRKQQETGGDVRLVLNDEDLLQVFEITMLDKVFKIYPSLEEATQSFSL
jgi:anti-anti-sigma factor